MGELTQPLLAALGMKSGAPNPSSMVGVVPSDNGMAAALQEDYPDLGPGSILGAGQQKFPPMLAAPPGYDGPMDPDVYQAAPAGAGMEQALMERFKPKKISFWGALGDQLMKHWGNEPVFSKRIQNKNMNKAMEGFTQDPVEAIRRLGKIPGMQDKAWDLLNQYQDNTRADAAQGRLMGKDRESIIDRANRMFGVVRPDGSNWPAVRSAYLEILKRNNITDVDLPEEYEPELIGAQIASGMTLNQQTMQDYRDRNLARQERNTDSQIQHRGVQQQQGNERLSQGRERLNQDVVEERGRNTRDLTPTPPKGGGAAQTVLPDGSMLTYGNPDKRKAQTAIWIGTDGEKRYMRKLPNGKWKVVAPPTNEKK